MNKEIKCGDIVKLNKEDPIEREVVATLGDIVAVCPVDDHSFVHWIGKDSLYITPEKCKKCGK